MKFMMHTEHAIRIRVLAPLLLVLSLFGCSSLFLEDCPEGGVIGEDKPRIRSWRVRTLLGDEASAADRFADHAAMSAYAYAEPADQDCGNEPKLKPEEMRRLAEWLNDAGWERIIDAEYAPSCEDDVGLFYHVWKRETAEKTEVIIAFRGTWGFNDWWYGNSYWFRRFFTDKHQYTAARMYAEKIMQYFHEKNVVGKELEFSSTGHSLGGGLAQAVLYDQVNTLNFKQAYAFAPSSATAYTSRRDKSPFSTCVSNGDYPHEPRIYRIYESYEILAILRIFHKLFFPTEPWINEVRFNYAEGTNPVAQHSMARFALRLIDKASAPAKRGVKPWYASPDDTCTDRFQESQRDACDANRVNRGPANAN